MEFDRNVMDLAVAGPPKPISEGKPVKASSQFSLVNGYDAARVNDGDPAHPLGLRGGYPQRLDRH